MKKQIEITKLLPKIKCEIQLNCKFILIFSQKTNGNHILCIYETLHLWEMLFVYLVTFVIE